MGLTNAGIKKLQVIPKLLHKCEDKKENSGSLQPFKLDES